MRDIPLKTVDNLRTRSVRGLHNRMQLFRIEATGEMRHIYELRAQHGEGAVLSKGSPNLWQVHVRGRRLRFRLVWVMRAGGQEWRDEAITLPMHSFDHERSTPMLSYCLADSGKALGQRRLTHKCAGPAVLEEVVTGHHTVLMLDEVEKHLKHFGLKSNYDARPPQLVALLIKDTITKAIDHGPSPPAITGAL
jgi:hypothetical protein